MHFFGRVTNRAIAIAVEVERRHGRGNEPAHEMLNEHMTQDGFRGVILPTYPHHPGRFDDIPTFKVCDLASLSDNIPVNTVVIDLFARTLAYMQLGENHPCLTNGRTVDGSNIPLYQHRILAEGRPCAYFAHSYWGQMVLDYAIEHVPERDAAFINAAFRRFTAPEMTMVHQWYNQRRFTLRSNTRTMPNLPRRGPSVHVTDGDLYHSAVFPVLIPNAHWFTIVAHNATRTLYLYDFVFPQEARFIDVEGNGRQQRRVLRCNEAIFGERMLNVVGEFLNQDRMRSDLEPVTWQMTEVLRQQLVHDTHSCGLTVILVMWLTAFFECPPTQDELVSLQYSPESMFQLRRWVANAILMDRIWSPPVAEKLVHVFRLYYRAEILSEYPGSDPQQI